MTGFVVFNRQHSSAAGYPVKTKITRPKLRRCSSVDDHNSFDLSPDENSTKDKFFTKFDATSSDEDSGIEDLDQQIINTVCEQTNNDLNEELPTVFGACDDEGLEENSSQTTVQTTENLENQNTFVLYQDLDLAAQISHEEKKEFCLDTSFVFHAEFARLISWPIALLHPGVRYYLFPEDEVNCDPCHWPNFACVKVDNAKAQFKCPNPECRRLWTSMRARISFKISYPVEKGFVVLKVYGQNCQTCETPAEALWYMEEVCRVMENLSRSIFETFFPSQIGADYSQDPQQVENLNKYSQRSRHDPQQRKGKMRAPHDATHCEACQFGLCFN